MPPQILQTIFILFLEMLFKFIYSVIFFRWRKLMTNISIEYKSIEINVFSLCSSCIYYQTHNHGLKIIHNRKNIIKTRTKMILFLVIRNCVKYIFRIVLSKIKLWTSCSSTFLWKRCLRHINFFMNFLEIWVAISELF